jgi:hypothetical protein
MSQGSSSWDEKYFRQKIVEKIKTHFFKKKNFPEFWHIWDNLKK